MREARRGLCLSGRDDGQILSETYLALGACEKQHWSLAGIMSQVVRPLPTPLRRVEV